MKETARSNVLIKFKQRSVPVIDHPEEEILICKMPELCLKVQQAVRTKATLTSIFTDLVACQLTIFSQKLAGKMLNPTRTSEMNQETTNSRVLKLPSSFSRQGPRIARVVPKICAKVALQTINRLVR
jgi:hypothetical protein